MLACFDIKCVIRTQSVQLFKYATFEWCFDGIFRPLRIFCLLLRHHLVICIPKIFTFRLILLVNWKDDLSALFNYQTVELTSLTLLLFWKVISLLFELCLCFGPQRSLSTLCFVYFMYMLIHWLVYIQQYFSFHICLFLRLLSPLWLFCLLGGFDRAYWSRSHLKPNFKLDEGGFMRILNISIILLLLSKGHICLEGWNIAVELKHWHGLTYPFFLVAILVLYDLHTQIHHVL